MKFNIQHGWLHRMISAQHKRSIIYSEVAHLQISVGGMYKHYIFILCCAVRSNYEQYSKPQLFAVKMPSTATTFRAKTESKSLIIRLIAQDGNHNRKLTDCTLASGGVCLRQTQKKSKGPLQILAARLTLFIYT